MKTLEKITGIIFLILVLSILATTTRAQKGIEDYKTLAELYRMQGEYEKAIQTYQKALEIAPQNITLHEKLALLYRERKMYDEAVAQYKELIELKPEGNLYRLYLAHTYREGERYQEAITEYEKILKLPNAPGLISTSHSKLPALYQEVGILGEKITEYEDRIKENPKNMETYMFLTELYKQKRDYQKVIIICKEGLKENRNDLKLCEILAKTYISKNRYGEALPEYQKLIELRPGYSPYYTQLARCYFKTGQREEAIHTLDKMILLSPEHSQTYSSVGWVYQDNGMYDKALGAFQKAVELGPGASTHEMLAEVYKVLGKDEEALREYREVIRLSTYEHKWIKASARIEIARIYRRRGEHEKAIPEYKRIIEEGGSRYFVPKAQEELINTYAKLGRLDELIREYKKRETKGEQTSQLYSALGEGYLRQGKSREAFQLYRDAVKKLPGEEVPKFRFAFARIYEKEKYFPQALVTYQQIIEEHPESKWAPRAQWKIAEIIGYRLGNYDWAFKEYQRLIDNYPQSDRVAYALQGIAECYEYKGDFKESLAKYQEIIERYPGSGAEYDAKLKVDAITKGNDYNGEPLKLYVLEYRYWKEGKFEESIKVCRELVSRYPRSYLAPSVQYYIGYMYQLELKNCEKAIEEYQKVLSKYPKCHRASFAQYQIGECYEELGKGELAKEAFLKVIKKYPDSQPAQWIRWR